MAERNRPSGTLMTVMMTLLKKDLAKLPRLQAAL